MSQERVKKPVSGENSEKNEKGKLSKKAEKLKEELDKLIDEIDDVLENNSEEFIKSYVQKGGE